MKSSTYFFHMKTKILFLTGLVIQHESLPSHVTTISQGMKFGRSRPEVCLQERCSQKFAKLTRKNLCQSLFFNKVAGLRPETVLKRRLWQRYFPVKFAKFLRTPFLWNTCRPDDCFWKLRIIFSIVSLKSNTFLLTSTWRKAFSNINIEKSFFQIKIF